MAIKIAVVEDDGEYAKRIVDSVRKYSQENDVELEPFWFCSALDFISDYAPVYDIVLMDIEMPHLDGMEAARKLRAKGDHAPLIFITNMAQYAVTGYEVDAIGFIVKPIEYYGFALQLRKAIERVKLSQNDYLSFFIRDAAMKIYINEIKFVEVSRHKIIYHTFYGDVEVPGTMTETEEKLKDHDFVRCNNCYLVNLRHVRGMKGSVVDVAGEELVVSRGKKQEFMHKLAAHFARGGGNR